MCPGCQGQRSGLRIVECRHQTHVISIDVDFCIAVGFWNLDLKIRARVVCTPGMPQTDRRGDQEAKEGVTSSPRSDHGHTKTPVSIGRQAHEPRVLTSKPGFLARRLAPKLSRSRLGSAKPAATFGQASSRAKQFTDCRETPTGPRVSSSRGRAYGSLGIDQLRVDDPYPQAAWGIDRFDPQLPARHLDRR